MFIVVESYASNDPRVVPEMEYLDHYNDWLFDVVYIRPENVSKVPLNEINYMEVPEAVARAAKFSKADANFRCSFEENGEQLSEIPNQTLDDHPNKFKKYYNLTEQDKLLLIEYYKIQMKLYINFHYRFLDAETIARNVQYRQNLINEINNLNSVEDCRTILHSKFDCHTASTVNSGPTKLDLHR